ncbi:MAG: hypothetical protein HYW65_03060 [Candidatus Liptonbacteria bacterium]|nr:hypothetical protein [Candidatus Liptonbacteria bacterium]
MATTTQNKQDVLAELGITKRELPKSWWQAIGILKGKRIDGLAYQKKIRGEWEKRLRKQVELARKSS